MTLCAGLDESPTVLLDRVTSPSAATTASSVTTPLWRGLDESAAAPTRLTAGAAPSQIVATVDSCRAAAMMVPPDRNSKLCDMAKDGKFRIEKFDGTYFGWWKMQIEDLLVQKDLDVVLGDTPEKMLDADWVGLDRKAMSVICLSLTKNVAFNIRKEKTAKGIIEALSNMYEKPSAAKKVFLIRELVNTRIKEGTSVTEHINKLNLILTRLVSVKIKFDDELQALLLLSSLPDSCIAESGYWRLWKGRLADDRALEVTGMGDMVLRTPVGFWTLKDVIVVPDLKKSLISVRQLNEQEHEVKFGKGQRKVVKGNLVMPRGRKSGSLYMVELPSKGVTAPVQKRNKVWFTVSWAE
ncbi:unnamed protein product [Cuscuta campestris]|uniref:Retrovirus-related Pol polyprotein from transposon TNT 1-94-like beta-barrel domain-containing protein n=1 Tax=Cuscuta campestris TaxID=132261 RepID=A0A484N492_9ASTE|nr:unnamed protein product [Cuscuta campestris]